MIEVFKIVLNYYDSEFLGVRPALFCNFTLFFFSLRRVCLRTSLRTLFFLNFNIHKHIPVVSNFCQWSMEKACMEMST